MEQNWAPRYKLMQLQPLNFLKKKVSLYTLEEKKNFVANSASKNWISVCKRIKRDPSLSLWSVYAFSSTTTLLATPRKS